MAWKKAKNNAAAVGTPILVGEHPDQHYIDGEGDTVFATSPEDFPKPVPQTSFMGIPTVPPAEGSLHSLLVKVANGVDAIKNHFGI